MDNQEYQDFLIMMVMMIIAVVSFVLIAAFTFLYLILMTKRHSHRAKADKLLGNTYQELPYSIRELYNSVLDRRQSSIVNFFIFQLTTKVFGFTGVLYSVCGFGLNFFNVPRALSVVVSFISLACVIIALYMSPEKRISEYIAAWRSYDKLATDMIGKLPYYNGKPGNSDEILDVVKEISEEISRIECTIISDES